MLKKLLTILAEAEDITEINIAAGIFLQQIETIEDDEREPLRLVESS